MEKKSAEQDPVILRKRLQKLIDSRNHWKEANRKGQIERKRLREKVKDEIERRDRWKENCKLQKQAEKSLVRKLEHFETKIEHQKNENTELRRQLEEIKKKEIELVSLDEEKRCKGYRYPTLLILVCIRLLISASASFRNVSASLKTIFSSYSYFENREIPAPDAF